MVQSAIADDYLLTYLGGIASDSLCAVGLILGQSCLGKDYVIHFAKTPPYQPEQFKHEGFPIVQLRQIAEVNESWVADHARQATRMLPGGMYVLGIFIISSEDLLSHFHPKIKSLLLTIHKQLEESPYLYGNTDNEKLVLNYSCKSNKYFAKSYNVVTASVQHAEFKFLPNATRWHIVQCNFEVDQVNYLKKDEADWPLQKHMKAILENIYEKLDNSVLLFDGESKDGDEYLENIRKKKKVSRSSNKMTYQELHDNSKPMQVAMFEICNSSNKRTSEVHEIFESGGQLRIIGQVACKLWLHPKLSITEASNAVKQDIMRSLQTRLEMHWDSLTEEENSEDINCVHEPPRRVLIRLPNSKITPQLSDYLFPGEGAQDAKVSLEELLDIKIDGKLEIEDIEGQADISEYYSSSPESDSEEILPILAADSNKFKYIVGLAGALFILILSLLIHFLK